MAPEILHLSININIPWQQVVAAGHKQSLGNYPGRGIILLSGGKEEGPRPRKQLSDGPFKNKVADSKTRGELYCEVAVRRRFAAYLQRIRGE